LLKGCSICGYNKCARALDFHHPNDKEFDISRAVLNHTNIDKIKKEMEKCIIVCKNCHTEIHSKEENLIIKEGRYKYESFPIKKSA